MKTIGIFTGGAKGQAPWDPDTIRTGITGSEESVIYMSKILANLGFRVFVFGDPPIGSLHSLASANPRYVGRTLSLSQPLDIAVAWRWPEGGSILKERSLGKKIYLWPHDAISQSVPSVGFDGVLWLSEWQRRQWVSLSPEFARFSEVFGNGINPEQFPAVSQRVNPYSCIYGSNYALGLELLLEIWPEVKKSFARATLDIYYGWQHWGLLSPKTERRMRDAIKFLPDVNEHGMVGHEELNRAYGEASFWTYPCIRSETFCISALRAQLSGAVPVVIDGSAFKETVRFGFKCPSPDEYLPLLLRAMATAEKISLEERKSMGRFILEEYTWKKVADKWYELFTQGGGA